LLAQAREKASERDLLSGLMFIAVSLSVAFSFVIAVSGLAIDRFLNVEQSVAVEMALFAFPLSLIGFKFYFQQIYQGTNEILKLSFYNFSVQFGFVLLLLVWKRFESLDLFSSLICHSVSSLAVTLALVWKGKPSFAAARRIWDKLLADAKAFGWSIYVGRLIGLIAANLDSLLIAAFFNSVSVGGYALALFFVSPIPLFSDAYLSATFKKLSAESLIPKKIFWINTLALLAGAAGYALFGHWIFSLLFPKHQENAWLVYPLLIPMVCAGLTRPYLSYFSSQGQGETIRQAATLSSILGVLFNVILIPFFGGLGAAIAATVYHLAGWSVYQRAYRRILSDLR
jgi:O-antigen/teichoic acid export membrane protein